MSEGAIAITGIGVISPYGAGLESMQSALLAGRCCLEPCSGYYPGFAGSVAAVRDLPRVEFRADFRLSRTDHLAVLAGQDALISLGGRCAGLTDAGVVMATTVAGLSEIEPEIVHDPAGWYRRGGLARAASYPVAHVADALGESLGVSGPRCAVTVACASGAMSIALAANMLLDGVADVMLAGGSDALCPFTLSGFGALQALDASPCRPFDKSRAGLNLGEGAAVLVIETFQHAWARHAPIFAMLRGWAMTNDAYHPTAPHEQGAGLAACMTSAMGMAHTRPDDIGYVNAHGTGTPLNDAAETKAYEAAFRHRSRPIPVSSTKSYFGHCLGAAGALEAAVTICAIRAGALFPTLRLSDPIDSPAVDWLRDAPRRQPLPLAMSVSAGFGGSNAALIFGEAAV
ncbi:MAG TPA: beta-ketoacyl-[acyl-carrier-protein] synthase family protein [Bryobacteraceae bacterium]|nr:beta-ketoacyl-[acyl-carrier-protein] synthase family protein [Bryobacteraceae bacterium]